MNWNWNELKLKLIEIKINWNKLKMKLIEMNCYETSHCSVVLYEVLNLQVYKEKLNNK